MSVVDQIKSRLDIVDYIQRYVPALKKAGRYYKAPCPFHAERTPSFVVSPDKQTWRCFGSCADGGDVIKFAMRQHGWSFGEALRELATLTGVELREYTPQERARNDQIEKLHGLLNVAADYYHEHLLSDADEHTRATLHYARTKRGFSDETIRTYRIGYAPSEWQAMLNALVKLGYSEDEVIAAGLVLRSDKGRAYDYFRNRLMIPICDERGRVVGFGARALDPNEKAKYINSPQGELFDKSSLLFGLDRAKTAIRESETAIIVEGYMDAIQAHQAGYRNVVAQMGTALTEAQLKLIAPRSARKILLALDSDAAGQNATRRSLEVARNTLEADYSGRLSIDIRILQIHEGKDPDDVLREHPARFQEYIDAALPVADFVIDMETAELSAQASVQEREAVARRVLPILTASENRLYTQDNLQKLALRLHIAERELLAWAQEIRRSEAQQKQRAQQAQRSQPPPPPAPGMAMSEEPPPRQDFDEMGGPPPLDDDDPLGPMPALLRRPSAQLRSSQAIERYCLSVLLRQPELLAQVNRTLRGLAGEDAPLRAGPLAALNELDFSQSEYRAILTIYHEALEQDEMDPLHYLRQHLDEMLADELEALLHPEAHELRQRLAERYSGDFTGALEEFQRRSATTMQRERDAIQRLLELRRTTLRRDLDELRFLLADLQAQDPQEELRYAQQGALLNRAWHKLNTALAPRELVPPRR